MKNHRTRLGTKFSEGARLLWVAIEKQKLSTAQVRKAIGASDGLVSNWLYGDKKPGRAYALKLAEIYDVPEAAWDQTPTEQFTPPAARTSAEPTDAVTESVSGC